MSDRDKAQAELRECGIKPGQIYRHYKGGLYTVIATAICEETLEPIVVYTSNMEETNWERTLKSWNESVVVKPDNPESYVIPRFIRVQK